MLNCDYTGNTNYKFYEKCCLNNENVNMIGKYPEDKMEKILSSKDYNKWTEFYLPKILDIPVQKPDIEGVIELHSHIEIISQRVIKTPVVYGYKSITGSFINGEDVANSECTNLTGRKLVIEGFLKQKIIYTANLDEQSVHSAHFLIPFSTFIIVEKDTPLSQQFRITPYIEDMFICTLSKRSIFSNTTIFIKASKIC